MFRHTLAFSCMALFLSLAPVNSSYAHVNNDINAWTDCGIGAVIFENDIAAAFSNIIGDLGTTAVTSMVVSPDTCEGTGVETALFILQTYPQLAVETARGNGKHLSAVAELRGCEKAVHADFLRQVRAGMASSVAQPEFAALNEAKKAE